MSVPELYVVDAQVWINLKNHYPPDLFGYIWDDIGLLVREKRLWSPQEIHAELDRGIDDLAKDLGKRYPGLFEPMTNAFLKEVAIVRARCPTLHDLNSDRNSGDLHIVALAMIKKATVVCNERRKKPTEGRMRIPDACDVFGVRCINWHDFLRERKKETSEE